jgi:ParB family transcriptional regulator, chromosome partitioning protein
MASAVQKVTLTSSQDIPFSKLRLSESNVRRTVAGVSIENLAEDIARRTLLQSLSVRPVLDAEGKETGTFEVQAGGRRYRALELLVKQKRMSKTQLVPCIVRTSGLAEEDSLAENVQRESLSALEQFLAFKTLREKGLGEEDIAARFFVSATTVKQRLKLATVSPKLLDVHAAGEMSLDQLMAFTVSDDHARQEEIWEQVSHTRGFTDEPYNIRRKLTEGAVRATDRRAVFVGIEAYEKAGGVVTRDLFEPDGGGWLQDPALLDRLVIEKLKAEAEKVQAEGWKWIAVATDFSYGHTAGLRSLHGRIVELTEEETTARQALEVELDGLQQQYAEADDVPEEADRRFEEIETELAAFNDRPVIYDPTEVALAGAFVSIDRDGTLRIDRGYVRPEDEPRTEPAETKGQEGAEAHRLPASASGGSQHGVITVGAPGASAPQAEAEEDDGIRPLSERLISELTAFRTLTLRDAVANNPHVAMTALLHKLCIDVFHQHAFENCLEATVREVSCPIQPADLDESVPAKAVKARHKAWLAELVPRTDTALWEWLDALSSARRQELLAHCVSFGVNAFYDKNDRGGPWGVKRRIAHADRLARAVGLDPVLAGWSPTVDNYLGRVPKARILEAVREAKGEASAQLIDHLKKPDMAKEAERLLAKTGWLPEPLRTPDAEAEEAECESDAEDLPAFLDEEDDEDSREIAAE